MIKEVPIMYEIDNQWQFSQIPNIEESNFNKILERFKNVDIVELKKQHPCGSKIWEITRVGVDFKFKCKGCMHVILVERPKALKMIKKKID